jgi:hypothetical protein
MSRGSYTVLRSAFRQLPNACEFGYRSDPELAVVAVAVVAQDPFALDAAGGHPGCGALGDRDGDLLAFVVVDLGVGHSAVVVDDGVNVGSAQLRIAVADLGLA